MIRAVIASGLVALLASGCARPPRPVPVPTAPAAVKAGIGALRADLAATFAAPAFRHAVWGVLVQSLRTGETLFAINPATLVMPASNMKLVTAAVAAERLGWNATFETRLVSVAPVEDGVLQGDLVIVGAGDPALGGRPGSAAAVLDAWAAQLRAAGVTRIAGRIVGDDNALDDDGLGPGWAWDDLVNAYATPAGAVSFAENTVQLTIAPAPTVGSPATVEGAPEGHGLSIVAHVVTGEAGSRPEIEVRRLPGSTVVTVTGRVPMGAAAVTRAISVDNPTAFTAGVLRAALIARGIAVDGDAVDIDTLGEPPATGAATTLASWTSPPLGELLKVLLKASQNLYADTLLRVLGRTSDAAAGAAERGQAVVRETLSGWGLPPDRYVHADGSGLSRYNYLSADLLVRILARMYQDPRHRAPFLDALPIAGVDGTLAGRMRGTKAEGNARAKTGSIANTRSLSGYVTSADGEPLVFSIIANNFNAPAQDALAVIDRAVVRLAEFRRR